AREDLNTLASRLESTSGVESVTKPEVLGNSNLALINVFPTTGPQAEDTTDLIHRLRKETIPPVKAQTGMDVLTTGLAPGAVDFSDYVTDKLPIFIGLVLGVAIPPLPVAF